LKGGRGLDWSRTKALQAPKEIDGTHSVLRDFEEFCKVDLQLDHLTVKGHLGQIRRFLEAVKQDPSKVSDQDIRNYLAKFADANSNTYANVLKGLKVFFRDFMNMPQAVSSFRFPKRQIEFKTVPSREKLQRFYAALETPRDRALFLVYATSGLRRSEVLGLEIGDIDFKNRMIKPTKNQSRTKHTWISFFNAEAEKALREYLVSRRDIDLRLFPMVNLKLIKKACKETGIRITPQVLREWFCSEMGKLGVPDRYIDAFCGRVPHSILARHYTDYNLETLKEIYDKAGLKVLC
jgi:integrase